MTKKIKLKISARLLKKRFHRQSAVVRKNCRFCTNKDQELQLDYKNALFLKSFLTEREKILPSRISGNCRLHQSYLSRVVKKARIMALIPYS